MWAVCEIYPGLVVVFLWCVYQVLGFGCCWCVVVVCVWLFMKLNFLEKKVAFSALKVFMCLTRSFIGKAFSDSIENCSDMIQEEVPDQ